MDGEQPSRFECLCLRALAEGAISESRTAELLGISTRALVDRIYEPPRSYGKLTEESTN